MSINPNIQKFQRSIISESNISASCQSRVSLVSISCQPRVIKKPENVFIFKDC